MRIRLLTLTIFVSLALLGVKIADLIERRQTVAEAFFAAPLLAQEEDGVEEEVPVEEPEEEADEEAPADGEKKVNDEDIEIPDLGPEEKSFSDTELDILQRLAERREKLREWEDELKMKENVLNITESRIDKKMSELRELKGQVESRLAEYNKKEQEKIRNLVKVYESMKPTAAAQIFAKMDTNTLLEVATEMKEKSLAGILAKMDPKAARDITELFAKRGRLPTPVVE